MNVDWTISVGNMIQVAVLSGGGALVLITMRSTVAVLQRDVTAIQVEIKKMGDILTKMAVAETRLDNTDTRLTNLERDIRDLRRGNGWITPTTRSVVDGEYP